MSLFQLNLRKQIRILPKILKSDSVKIIHYYSLSFIRVLRHHGDAHAQGQDDGGGAGPPERGDLLAVGLPQVERGVRTRLNNIE